MQRKNKTIKRVFLAGVLSAAIFMPGASLFAQDEKLTFTITPPLIKNNVNPGQDWNNAVRVVNNNPKGMDIYVRVMDFKGGGETGNVKLLKESEIDEKGNFLLSKWIVVDPGPYEIPAFGSKDIPFAVQVPEDAEPGGRYAAILVGTQPPDDSAQQGSVMKVSSLIGSLLLLNVNGDIEERGWIREFSTGKRFYSSPSVDFNLRFENAGNVHVIPQGSIKITTMFGEEKEPIKINHATEFNNVLPGDIRKWEFRWEDKKNIFEMGRYKAEVILTFGEQTKETITQTVYFWVIYAKPLIIIFSLLAIFILLLTLFIRSYIRRALIRTQSQIQAIREAGEAPASQPPRTEKRKPEPKPKTEADEKIRKTQIKKTRKKANEPVDLRRK